MINKYKTITTTLMVTIIFAHQSINNVHCDVVDEISMFDNDLFRILFHTFRNFTFRLVGSTGQRTHGSFLQEPQSQFPCNTVGMRSKRKPNSVHMLRPGDIDVIAALGDSLTAASGAASMRMQDLFMENRGLSWSIGGQWNWRNVTTLPNILKEYNPNLIGYSRNDAYPFHEDSQFNMAEIGAVSADIPYMAKALVRRIKKDKRINFKKDWKMVTLCMGGNDICSFICTMNDPDSLPKKHKERIIKALRYMRDHMPRTFVNIVPVPLIDSVISLKDKPLQCDILHHGECSCWVGQLYNQTKELQDHYNRIQKEMIAAEEEVGNMKEFQGLREFAVMFQPWSKGLNFTTDRATYDLSLLAFDCFHMSQKGNAWAGIALWNNLLEPPGKKSFNWVSPKKRFHCPTAEHPYIYTNDNHKNVAIVNSITSRSYKV